MNKLFFLTSFCFFAFSLLAQDDFYKQKKYFTVVSYNVENLFDTINDPDKEDDEFTPDSEKKWNTDKYQLKIKSIARVISSINKHELPELVGLVEVENKNVIQDLINDSQLVGGDYGIIHEESPDARGIDVALIYRKSEFQYLNHQTYRISFDFDPETTTRDILYVRGKLDDNKDLHIFVNHWSSRREGKEVSEPKRIEAAKVLRAKVDKILDKNKKARIVIIGDFNDEPTDSSLVAVLSATNDQFSKNNRMLYNLLFDKYLLGYGTYNYKGNWNMIDNIIVSKSLLSKNGNYIVSQDGGQIFSERWLMYDNVKTGQLTPNRTYGGPYYHGGFSDHLPVYFILKSK